MPMKKNNSKRGSGLGHMTLFFKIMDPFLHIFAVRLQHRLRSINH